MKNVLRSAAAGALSVVLTAGAATASIIVDTFSVTAVRVTNLTSNESQATMANFNAALTNPSFGGGNSVKISDIFTYTGALDFSTDTSNANPPDTTTILQWLNSGGGMLNDLDASFGGLQLSSPDINNGSATTTFFLFEKASPLQSGLRFEVVHDDGFGIFENDSLLGGNVGPTARRTQTVSGYDGGAFSLLYVATNGDPSILQVAAVPLPAGVLLLGLGLGGLAVYRRRAAA